MCHPALCHRFTENPGSHPYSPFSAKLPSLQWPTPQVLATAPTQRLINLCLLSSVEPLCALLTLHLWNHYLEIVPGKKQRFLRLTSWLTILLEITSYCLILGKILSSVIDVYRRTANSLLVTPLGPERAKVKFLMQ